MTLPLSVWGSRVLLQDVSQDAVSDRKGSLYIPQSVADQQRHMRWVIMAVGELVREPELQPGMEVIASRWATEEILWEGVRYRVAYAENIIATVTYAD